MNIIRPITAALALCAMLLATPAFAHHLKVGSPAPELVLHTLDGKSIDTADLKGKVVIVTFWASWCDICREELPMLSAYAAAHREQGLVVLGFSLDESSDMKEVKKVASTLSFPVGLLGSQYAGEYGRVWRLPVSFVLDRKGHLVDNGWDDEQPVWTAARLKQVVDPLLR